MAVYALCVEYYMHRSLQHLSILLSFMVSTAGLDRSHASVQAAVEPCTQNCHRCAADVTMNSLGQGKCSQ